MTKTIFIPAKSKTSLNKIKILEISKKLPKTIDMAYSIQFKDLAFQIKDILELQNHKIKKIVQVLGCSNPRFSKETQAVLLIGSGKFHAVSLAYETKLPIYILENKSFSKISSSDLEIFGKKQKSNQLRLLNSNNIGILVSTKPGQENLSRSLDLKKKLESKGKKVYMFINNSIDVKELENFPDVEVWINTACPRLDMNSKDLLNIGDVEKILFHL
ncbi:MAG: diphthamide synthesis protein [Candidatus Nanoarchaeia archaeon]